MAATDKTIWECDLCGALVRTSSRPTHEKFHDEVVVEVVQRVLASQIIDGSAPPEVSGNV